MNIDTTKLRAAMDEVNAVIDAGGEHWAGPLPELVARNDDNDSLEDMRKVQEQFGGFGVEYNSGVWNHTGEYGFKRDVCAYRIRAKHSDTFDKTCMDEETFERAAIDNGDTIKVVQNLPGTARPMFGGGELVLRGASRLIEAARPIVFLELYESYCEGYGYTLADVFALFDEQGYRSFVVADGPRPVKTDAASYLGRGDVLFAPPC